MSDRSLFILEAKLEDAGSYSCIARNSEGLGFASVHMVVGSKLKIDFDLKHYSIVFIPPYMIFYSTTQFFF